jgi:hypothetical protein
MARLARLDDVTETGKFDPSSERTRALLARDNEGAARGERGASWEGLKYAMEDCLLLAREVPGVDGEAKGDDTVLAKYPNDPGSRRMLARFVRVSDSDRMGEFPRRDADCGD